MNCTSFSDCDCDCQIVWAGIYFLVRYNSTVHSKVIVCLLFVSCGECGLCLRGISVSKTWSWLPEVQEVENCLWNSFHRSPLKMYIKSLMLYSIEICCLRGIISVSKTWSWLPEVQEVENCLWNSFHRSPLKMYIKSLMLYSIEIWCLRGIISVSKTWSWLPEVQEVENCLWNSFHRSPLKVYIKSLMLYNIEIWCLSNNISVYMSIYVVYMYNM